MPDSWGQSPAQPSTSCPTVGAPRASDRASLASSHHSLLMIPKHSEQGLAHLAVLCDK